METEVIVAIVVGIAVVGALVKMFFGKKKESTSGGTTGGNGTRNSNTRPE